MYIWRFPFTAAANLFVLAILLPCLSALAGLRTRLTGERARLVIAAALVLCVLVSPLFVSLLFERRVEANAAILEAHGQTLSRIDPAPGMNCLAAIFAAVLAPSAFAFFRTRRARGMYLLGGWIFVALNLINACAPGWCEHFGFPFRYYWWSDALLFDETGRNLTAGFSWLAIAANAGCFALAAIALSVATRRARPIIKVV